MTPKEDPKDKAARLRERRIADLERTSSTERAASGLSSDLRAVYGLSSISMFGSRGGGGSPAPRPTSKLPGSGGGKSK